ncbi:MAG: hypothetical protein HYT03_03580 [Candidatus Harrisonbacteria bacterium]|nr:hypothetical protein [Candidatus Harrisonbacteria bacterium]
MNLVIVKLAKTILSLLNGQNDKFLVLEIFENFARAAEIKANFSKKQIKVMSVLSEDSLPKLLKQLPNPKRYKILTILDSHLATTVYSSMVLVRENYKELIDEPELDNLISQAIWKYFDRQRHKIATKMGVTDLDIVLTDVKIRGMRLDGHKVVNPIGFKSKTVEVQFSQTFLLRGFINKIKNSLPLDQMVFVSEHGPAWSSVITKSHKTDNFLLAGLFQDKTLLFLADGGQHSYWNKFNWGELSLHLSLAGDLSLDTETSAKIISKYVAGDASETFKRRLEGLLSKELDVLARGLDLAAKKTDTKTIYVHTFFDLPNLFNGNFRNRFERAVELKPLTVDLIAQNFDFDIIFKNDGDSKYAFGLIAGLLEWYLSPQDDKLSQLAKRRVRWLSPI